jgi:cell wall-associated NlpC family hydrolase
MPIIIIAALLMSAFMSLLNIFASIGSGSMGSITAGTYLAADGDILGAEAFYAGKEADLQHKLDNYETLNPGYDEYVFNLDSIWHDPYVLAAILSAIHEGEWTLDEVMGTLEMLFLRQYILTEATAVEVRTRTETGTYTDPETGETGEYEYEVECNYYICTVTLKNCDLSHLPVEVMSEYTLSRYALYMMTLGNRPDLYPVSSYPNASYYQDYGRHDIPQSYRDADQVFDAVITEANKWLGMPYVWGGSSPVTSFDCSGYISWVLNQSGFNVGRLSAQGLYDISSPVSAANVKPGDLVFFVGTYNTSGVSHAGIYAGDGMMVHCGNPIGYASINTSYWQSHFYSFGKLY